MKKTILSLIFIVFIALVIAYDDNEIEGNVVDEVGDVYGLAEPVGFWQRIGLFFVNPQDCPVVNSVRVDYTEGIKDDGTVISYYGNLCAVGDYITLLACEGPSTVSSNCERIFNDDYYKESVDDRLYVTSACGGENCYDVPWYQDAIANRYVGYDCKHCGTEGCDEFGKNGDDGDWMCLSEEEVYYCMDSSWKLMSVNCDVCNTNEISYSLDNVCSTSGDKCTQPPADIGYWYCNIDEEIFECLNTGKWHIDGYCGDVPGYRAVCKFPDEPAENRDTLCIKDETECSEDTDCDDNDLCTLDYCLSNGKCQYTKKQCGSGKVCKAGVCIDLPACETDADCNDNNPATEDKCVDNKCKNTNRTLNTIYIIGGVLGGLVAIGLLVWFVKKK